jgi:DNA primase
MTSRDVIEHIREAVDFPALVEETIPLPRYPDGKPVLVRCPFHDDHHPSLAIYQRPRPLLRLWLAR